MMILEFVTLILKKYRNKIQTHKESEKEEKEEEKERTERNKKINTVSYFFDFRTVDDWQGSNSLSCKAGRHTMERFDL